SAVFSKFHYAKALWIFNHVAENRSTRFPCGSALELVGEVLAVEDVVAQNQAYPVIADEFFADDKSLGQAVRIGLNGITEPNTKLFSGAQKPLILGKVIRCRNDQHFADTCQHEHRDGVVNHRLVVDWQELFRHTEGDRM